MNERVSETCVVLRSVDHRKMRWLNGGGWTREIVAWPSRDDWKWRVSVADIESDGPFSALPGVDRSIAMLSGNGFALTTSLGTVAILRQCELFEFSGDESTMCTLVDGAVQDLNLMVRRSFAPMQLAFVDVIGSTELVGIELGIVVSGTVHFGEHVLSRLDAIRLNTASTVVVSSVGEQPATVACVSTFPSVGT